MEKSATSKIDNLLNVEYNNDNSIWLTNSYTLRKVIGFLGMSLPFLLYGFLYIDTGYCETLQSLSHYYYTRVSSIFIAILSILAIFLIIYKGKEPIDFYTSLIAGISILLVVLFPTSNITENCCDTNEVYSVTFLKLSNFRVGFHYFSAGIFLCCLSYMSLFIFTKSNKSPNKRGSKKVIRNRIYRVCGVLMIAAMLIMVAGAVKLISEEVYEHYKLTFWMETLAVLSFGFSWLIKGETLFQDS